MHLSNVDNVQAIQIVGNTDVLRTHVTTLFEKMSLEYYFKANRLCPCMQIYQCILEQFGYVSTIYLFGKICVLNYSVEFKTYL